MPAPWFKRHRNNAQLKAFVQGATAAATGAIAGAVVVLGLRSIFDVPTALIGLVSLRPAVAIQAPGADRGDGRRRGRADRLAADAKHHLIERRAGSADQDVT